MRIRLGGHNYETYVLARVRYILRAITGRYPTPKPQLIGHGEGCCDYWQPATPEDFMLDDEFTIKRSQK